MSDKPLKSAYELAMERLRAADRDQGVEQQVLTAAQKAEIARLRQETKAKLAEIEILHRDELAGADPARHAELEQQHRVDRERVESRLETAVQRVREQGSDEGD